MLQGRKGFTLIELLIVVVIIGILAAIAIPKFANTKEKAYIASMKSDLRNLSTALETYYADNQVYTTSLPVSAYHPSPLVTVNIGTADATHWSASATHPGTTKTCVLTYNGGGTSDGTPVCA